MAANLQLILTAVDNFSPVIRKASAETSKLDGAMNNMKSAMIPAAAGIAAGVAAALKFADAAGDLGEAQNKVLVTFGASAQKVEEFAKSATKSYGLSQRAANEYAGTLGTILNASGLSEDATADMSIRLTQLAADMASFNNIGMDQALEKIKAGPS